jgi:hypothetical protein
VANGDVGCEAYTAIAWGVGLNAPRQDIPLDWVRGIERLHRLPARAGVPQHRWGVFLNDFDQFIHGRCGWAERAGWDTLALFGCHLTRPLDHLNGAGLLWRICGGKITAMRSDWATFEIDGVQHIVHRRTRQPPSYCRGRDRHHERYCGMASCCHSATRKPFTLASHVLSHRPPSIGGRPPRFRDFQRQTRPSCAEPVSSLRLSILRSPTFQVLRPVSISFIGSDSAS